MGNAERTPIPPRRIDRKRRERRCEAVPSRKSLAELQSRFQAAIKDGDDAFLEDIKDSSREDREVLLGVYRYAYGARLIEFLANDYEKLLPYLGDEQFERMARDYIAANPSQHPNGRWFGVKLPGFLASTPPYSDQPVLADLAALECALNNVFDAQDAAVITVEDLAKIPPEDWQSLIFTSNPATSRLTLNTNATDIWMALNEEAEPPQPEQREPQHILAYRNDFTSMFREMPYEEAMVWDEAVKGVPFGLLCEMLATYDGEQDVALRAAAFLKGWLDQGLISGLRQAGST